MSICLSRVRRAESNMPLIHFFLVECGEKRPLDIIREETAQLLGLGVISDGGYIWSSPKGRINNNKTITVYAFVDQNHPLLPI